MSSRKEQQSEATRRALVRVGRDLFARRGFNDVSTEEIVRRAGVTRGALYHHFRDKRDLFEAVYEDVDQSLVEKITSSIRTAADPLDVLRQGADAFLDACLDPAVRRIALLEGPSILGWERWREIDERYGLGLVQMTLQAAMDSGAIRPGSVEALAHVLFGGLVEAAMLLAASPTPKKARAEVGTAVHVLIDGLAAPRRAGQSAGRRRAQR